MSLGEEMLERDPRDDPRGSRCELGVVGLINVQYAVAGGELYVIEANPRASRTVPVRLQGDRRAAGEDRLPADARRARSPTSELPGDAADGHVCVKEAVLPFARFAGADALLGPGDEVAPAR